MSKRPSFDPYALLETLDRHHVTYIVIGGFARVIQGTDEITRGLDIVPSTRPENLRRLTDALVELGASGAEFLPRHRCRCRRRAVTCGSCRSRPGRGATTT